jgi:histidine phosphotransferase ChpT
MGFQLRAEGPYAKVQSSIEGLLTNGSAEAIDAHAIQPHYTGLLARDAGLKISLTSASESFVLTAQA